MVRNSAILFFLTAGLLAFGMTGCSASGHTDMSSAEEDADAGSEETANGADIVESAGMAESGEAMFTVDTKVLDVINDPAFGDYGRLIFSADRSVSDDLTLGNVGDILTWYSYVDPDRTVEIANYLKEHAALGEQIFYDIYTDAEKAADPAKEDIGLFFFRGTPGEKFAITNAGGGFVYVAAMHDSFPHALELSKKGLNYFFNILSIIVLTTVYGSF